MAVDVADRAVNEHRRGARVAPLVITFMIAKGHAASA